MPIAASPRRAAAVVAVYPVAERALPPPMTGRGRLATGVRWAGGFAELLLVGLAIPVGILLAGLPLALLVGLTIQLFGRL